MGVSRTERFWPCGLPRIIPYGALLAMWATADGVDAAELLRIREGSGPAKRTEIREDGRVPEEQIVKGRVYAAKKGGSGSGGASKRDNAHIRHEEEDKVTKDDEGGIGNKHGEGIPCIAEDSLETIFENWRPIRMRMMLVSRRSASSSLRWSRRASRR